MLATQSPDFSRSQISKSLLDGWQQRAEVVDIVAGSGHDNDADVEARQVLLILDALIDSQESVELYVGEQEQLPVFDTRPAHVLNSFHVVAGQFPFEPLRNALIEKKAHERRVA
jgi:hypothetical protein